MTTLTGRMLLSHNFALTDDRVKAIDRAAFAAIFIDGLAADGIVGQLIDNPHWIVDLRFDPMGIEPKIVGDRCAQVLRNFRQQEQPQLLPQFLILGGLKSTPPTSPSPLALQPGEWGVDVVETADGDSFLAGIGWAATIATRDPATIFQVRL
jgi:Protein of unknown function (DUF2656)